LPAAAAVVASTAVGFIAANEQADAAGDAAGAQIDAAREANATNLAIYQDQRNLMMPSARAGAEARARQMLMQGYTPEQVQRFLGDSFSAFGAAAPGAVDSAESLRQRYPQVYAEWTDPGRDGIAGNRNRQPNFANFVASRGHSVAPVSIQEGAGGPQADQFDWVEDWSYESSSPSYGFRFDEGARALERSAAARGRLFSGATGRALTRYGQDFASQEFENDFRRLGSLAGDGQQATGTIVNVAGQYGDNVSANQLRAGDARASGYINQGNAMANFWGNTVPGAIGWGMGQGWFK